MCEVRDVRMCGVRDVCVERGMKDVCAVGDVCGVGDVWVCMLMYMCECMLCVVVYLNVSYFHSQHILLPPLCVCVCMCIWWGWDVNEEPTVPGSSSSPSSSSLA